MKKFILLFLSLSLANTIHAAAAADDAVPTAIVPGSPEMVALLYPCTLHVLFEPKDAPAPTARPASLPPVGGLTVLMQESTQEIFMFWTAASLLTPPPGKKLVGAYASWSDNTTLFPLPLLATLPDKMTALLRPREPIHLAEVQRVIAQANESKKDGAPLMLTVKPSTGS